MTDQEKYFLQKFNDCSKSLCAKPEDIVSLKFRNLRDNQYYHELLHTLENIKDIDVQTIGYKMGGNAYIIKNSKQKIILVEHETGLELLYIAGSIASLISLILQVSSMINNHRKMNHFSPHDHEGIEIRYIDKKGKFVEEHKPYYLPYEMLLSSIHENEYELLNKRLDAIEKKVNKIIGAQKATAKKK